MWMVTEYNYLKELSHEFNDDEDSKINKQHLRKLKQLKVMCNVMHKCTTSASYKRIMNH